VSLLLPAALSCPIQAWRCRSYDTSYILEPRLLLETWTEFEMARYRILQRVG
jgi:hypothetical protein